MRVDSARRLSAGSIEVRWLPELVVALHDEEPQLRMTIALGGRRVDEEAAGESGGRPGLRYREHGRNAAAER